MNVKKVLLSLSFIISIALSIDVFADCSPNDNCWHNVAIAYSWIFGQKGDLTIGNTTSELDVTPKDVVENLDLIDFILQLHLETCKGKWAFMIDPTILATTERTTLTTPLPTPNPQNLTLNITSKTKFSLVDAGVFYTLFSRCFCETQRWIKLEGLFGIRNLYMDADIDISPLTRLSNGANWFGALAGARLTAHVYNGLNLSLRGDVSAGSRSYSYSATALFIYQFRRHFVLGGGFRYLDFCGENDSGDDRFDLDVCYYGPVLGLGVLW